MNAFNRAVVNIIRKPGKTFIFLTLVFLLGMFLSGAISIRNAIHKTEANLRAQLPAVATLEWDYEAAYQLDENRNWEFPTVEMINNVGNLPYVKDYDFTNVTSVFSRDLEWVTVPIDQDLLPEWVTSEDIERIQSGFRSHGGYVEIFTLKGVNNPNPTDLQTGLISLASGRFMTQEEIDSGAPVAVISRSFADANNLQVNSKIHLENNVYDDLGMARDNKYEHSLYWHLDDYILGSRMVEFEVVGIFDVKQQEPFYYGNSTAVMMIARETELYNQIYVPNKINEEIAEFIVEHRPDFYGDNETAENLLTVQSTFVLNDPRDLRALVEAASEILPEFWEVRDLSGIYGPITSSMDTMLWIANLILWGTAMATIIILSLLITLFLRDRKYEIGIYIAMGEKKVKIISQILIEVLSASIVSIILALFAGNILSGVISRQIIQQNIIREEQENYFGLDDTGIPWELALLNPGTMSAEEMVAAYDASLDAVTVITIFGVGVGVILISTVLPILYIVRINPKKILM